MNLRGLGIREPGKCPHKCLTEIAEPYKSQSRRQEHFRKKRRLFASPKVDIGRQFVFPLANRLKGGTYRARTSFRAEPIRQ
jgi:hypothetical protein